MAQSWGLARSVRPSRRQLGHRPTQGGEPPGRLHVALLDRQLVAPARVVEVAGVLACVAVRVDDLGQLGAIKPAGPGAA